MGDDLQASLESYRIQLQQVEAALAAESDNEELKKLKVDLEEIIAITEELLQPNKAKNAPGNNRVPSESGDSRSQSPIESSSNGAQGTEASTSDNPVKNWKVGDRCMAIWSKNGQYYEAVIDGISEGKAAITFAGYNVTEINKLSQLRLYDEQKHGKKYVWDSKTRTGKMQFQADKERRRKKALKKAQRMKQIEDEKESDKNKWKDFSTKAMAKSMKGVKRESIFASPHTTQGRVGVGTCGAAGKPMTKATQQEKPYLPSSSKTHPSVF